MCPKSKVARRRRVALLVAELYEGSRSLDEVMNALAGAAHSHSNARIRQLVAEFGR